MKLYKAADWRTIFTVQEAIEIYKLEGIAIYSSIDWTEAYRICRMRWFNIDIEAYQWVYSQIGLLLSSYKEWYSPIIILPIRRQTTFYILNYDDAGEWNVFRHSDISRSTRERLSIFIP